MMLPPVRVGDNATRGQACGPAVCLSRPSLSHPPAMRRGSPCLDESRAENLRPAQPGITCIIGPGMSPVPGMFMPCTYSMPTLGLRQRRQRAIGGVAGRERVLPFVGSATAATHRARRMDEAWPVEGTPTSFDARHKARRPASPGPDLQARAASGIRRLLAGPFLPSPLIKPSRIPFVPGAAGLRFQAVIPGTWACLSPGHSWRRPRRVQRRCRPGARPDDDGRGSRRQGGAPGRCLTVPLMDSRGLARTGVGTAHRRRPSPWDEERPTVFLSSVQGKARRVSRKLLGLYLNDHLAGAALGLELVRRTARENKDSALGSFLANVLLPEIEEDRRTLQRLMGQIGIAPSRPKVAAAWLAEKLGRLKLNGELWRYSPLSRLVELEGLAVGIEGKRALWLALEAARLDGLSGFDFQALAERAEFQRSRVEEHRLAAVTAALGERSTAATGGKK